MWNDHMWWGGGSFMMILWTILIVAAIIWIIRSIQGSNSKSKEKEAALDILKSRCAKGEITK